MNFTLLDWSAIVAYLGITLFLGLYFCGGYAARSHRPVLHARRRRQLAVVGVLAIRHDDSFFVCAAVAALRPAHRCAVRRDAVFGQASGISPWISGALSRPSHELPDPRLGHQGDD